METVKIIECPRDAMQGIKTFIPTKRKVTYIQSLLRVGFNTIDFGSFVSAKAIPQMQDTHKTIAESLVTLQEILEVADKSNKEVVAYLSMGFGNPYGDPWSTEI